MPQIPVDSNQKKQGHIYALRLLTASKKSSAELAKRLQDKGYSPEVIETIITDLQNQKLLSDVNLVRDTVTWSIQSKHLGKHRVRLELKRRGIQNDLIENALTQIDPTEEKERARELASIRWSKFYKIDLKRRKKKVYDFLIGRGYDFCVAKEMIDELSAQQYENK
jgi:regulatory protein